MKRLLSSIILCVLILNTFFTLDVFAENKEAIRYGANEAFIIVIPPGFSFDESKEYITNISAQDVLISDNKVLKISLSSKNYNGGWRADKINEENNYIFYEIGTNNKYLVDLDTIILAVNSGEKYNGEVTQDLYFRVASKGSGDYYDILTFIVSVK